MKNFILALILAVFLSLLSCTPSGNPEAWKYYLPDIKIGQTATFECRKTNEKEGIHNQLVEIEKYTRLNDNTFSRISDVSPVSSLPPSYYEFKIKDNKVINTKVKTAFVNNDNLDDEYWPSEVKVGSLIKVERDNGVLVVAKNLTVGNFKDCIQTKQEIKKATKPGVNKEKEETWL